jgi:hypothetical protein
MHDGRRICAPEAGTAAPAVSSGPVVITHQCSGDHGRRLSLVGHTAIPVRLSRLVDDRDALTLELPPLLPVALHAMPGVDVACPALQTLAWRLVGRERVELHGLPEQPAACLVDWIRRAAVGDLVGDIGGVA